jgi:hypothetical protein
MDRYVIELRSLCDWQSRLGEPVLHWKRGASAMELAIQWTMAAGNPGSGVPRGVEEMLAVVPGGEQCKVKIAIPELQTEIGGKGKSSQTDLWVLLDSPNGFLSLSVEAKAREPFGQRTGQWVDVERDQGRWVRLRSLCAELGLDPESDLVKGVMYQLLHRTVATLIEAREWRASAAVMLVQCFAAGSREADQSWEHFRTFCAALGADSERGRLSQATGVPGDLPLWLGWLDCGCADDATALAVLGQSRASLKAALNQSKGNRQATGDNTNLRHGLPRQREVLRSTGIRTSLRRRKDGMNGGL